ncbi:MAG: GGDEF domain-containing protein [Desulfuromonadales bacterium]|nr:GGDEF domain-containing protein [Desulfuromonadales bacterium]
MDLNKLLQNDIKLPSPPNIALRLMAEMRKDVFSFSDIARIIQFDPALTAKVLKVVNSSFYSLPQKVTSIERALAILGVHAVKNIALSFTLIDGLNMDTASTFNISYFWKRALVAAIGSELFSRYLKIHDKDIFITALLQNLGILILNCHFHEEYARLIQEKNRTMVPIDILEKRIFGFNHQELCSEVLKQWGLPENIYQPILYHHGYRDAPEGFRDQARVLYLSNALSSIFSDTESSDKIRYFADILKDDLGISDAELESLVDQGTDRITEMCSSLDIPSDNIKPLSTLLQEANEGLSDLNQAYEKLLADFKREKLQAEMLAQELRETNDKLIMANRELEDISTRDYLTGLYNRRHLFAQLETELCRAERYGVCFSILIFDVDYFKKINDTHGHQSGDFVLQTLSNSASGSIREIDILARYGGEEFVVVMPQTDLKGAVAIAERLRLAVEKMEIPIQGKILNITVSIGVATYQPHARKMTIVEFVDRADQALYEAKCSGRNRVVCADT